MNRMKFALAAGLLGAAVVLPTASPAQASSCSMGANPLPFNTCTAPFPCGPTVSVSVSMTGAGSVTGTATCLPASVSCTAVGPGPSTCTGGPVPAAPALLGCGAVVTGVVPIWQVTCTS